MSLFTLDISDSNFNDCLRTLLLSNKSNELQSIENRLDDNNIDYKVNSKKIKYQNKKS